MCLSNENWSLSHLFSNIKSMVDNFKVCFPFISNVASSDRLINWNNNNLINVILNVDGSCMSFPIRAVYEGVLRNNACFYFSDFSGFIHSSTDILYAKLYAIYKGLLLAKDLEITSLVCYPIFVHNINLVKGPFFKFHVYGVLIQDIKERIEQSSVIVYHRICGS